MTEQSKTDNADKDLGVLLALARLGLSTRAPCLGEDLHEGRLVTHEEFHFVESIRECSYFVAELLNIARILLFLARESLDLVRECLEHPLRGREAVVGF